MKKNWTKEIMWIVGGIDAYGHVIGHEVLKDGYDSAHTAEEKAHTPWRWDVSEQMMMDHLIPPPRDMTEDEFIKVQDWLVNRGYAEDKSFTNSNINANTK